MPYAAVNGLKMYYEVHGDGPPLLLLHGGSGSIPETWVPYQVALEWMSGVLEHG